MTTAALMQFTLIIGLLDAAPLILAAVGFTMIYKLNGFVNVNFGETLMAGAYAGFFFNSVLGMNFYAAIIPAVLVSGLVSVATFLCVFRPAMRRGVSGIELVIMSVGLSYLLRYGLTMFTGVQAKSFTRRTSFLQVFGIGVTDMQLICLALAAVVSGLFLLFIFKTNYGEKMRALSDNEQLAKSSGINPLAVSVLIWFMAGVAGGFAGMFLGAFSYIVPWMGWDQILFIMMITIIGGVGSVPGAIVAGFVASLLTAFATMLSNTYTATILLLLLFIAALKYKVIKAGGIKA